MIYKVKIRLIITTCFFVVFALISGCEKGPTSGQGELKIYLTDSPAGYDAVNLSGGMRAWQHAGEKLVDRSGKPGRVT